jgi:hypothetical protein
MSLQKFTTGVCHALLRFPDKRPYLQCWGFLHTVALLHHVVQVVHTKCHTDRSHTHSTEHDTQPIAYLISKQVIPYRAHGCTCCPGVSTPMTQSLANSSMTNHKPWRSQPSPPFQSLLEPQYRISPRSPYIMTGGRPILSTHNTSQTQHHKYGKCVRHSWL